MNLPFRAKFWHRNSISIIINRTVTAKKGLIQRGERRQELGRKYHSIRRSPKGKMSEASSLDGRWEIHKESQSLPRNSAPTRLHRRRLLTGRPGANHRDSGPPRHVPREMAHACLSPGPVKSSWQTSKRSRLKCD